MYLKTKTEKYTSLPKSSGLQSSQFTISILIVIVLINKKKMHTEVFLFFFFLSRKPMGYRHENVVLIVLTKK